jgi:hypothetical protein
VILPERLRDRDDLDSQPLAQHLLVAPHFDLVSRETRRVADEHGVELALCRVGHKALKLRPPAGPLPAGVEVAVLADERETVLAGELADRLALCIG